jgi:hypothetical protein
MASPHRDTPPTSRVHKFPGTRPRHTQRAKQSQLKGRRGLKDRLQLRFRKDATVGLSLALHALQFRVALHDVRRDVLQIERVVKSAFAALIDLLTCETVQPPFRSALKCAFMSARLMLRMSRGPSGGSLSFG